MKRKFGGLIALQLCLVLCCLGVHAQGTVVTVPFDFVHNEIILKVKVNGLEPYNMMLDLNSDPSAIDIKTARELNLKLKAVGKPATGGGAGAAQIFSTRLPQVAVGDLVVKDLETVAIDLSKLSERLGLTLHGVLGNSLTKNRVVQIDYPGKVVRFAAASLASDKQQDPAKRVTLPFEFNEDVSSIIVNDVYVNGRKMKGTFDTGSDGAFKLTWDAVVELGLQEEAQNGEAGSSVGFNGGTPFTKGKVQSIKIGQLSVESPEVIYFAKGAGRDNKPWRLVIGNVFLKEFIFTIDYRRKQITLEHP